MRTHVAIGATVGGLVLAGLVLVVSEAGMQANPGERWTLYGVFAASVALAGAVSWSLMRVQRRLPSLRWAILVVAVAAVVVASAVVAASTNAMLLAPSDLRLVLAALLLGAGLGVLTAVIVTGPLTSDLQHLAEAARRVADGDLDVRTDIRRNDEVGELADSLDRMVGQLARLQEVRERGEAARRRLLASIGHDLRTPLASQQAAIEALQDGVAIDSDRYLRSMASDVELLSSMVDDLFVLALLEAGDLDLDLLPVDLAELADGAVEAVTAIAARTDVAVLLHADGPVPVTVDTQAVNRILRNILDNAIRYAPRGTEVSVEVTARNGDGVVRVHDDGPGFPPDFVDQAFELSSRADAARERLGGGAGLGLAIAKQLVQSQGGQIRIEPGEGATVSFSLPLQAQHQHTG